INPSDANLPFIVKDSLEFMNGNITQEVKLVAWGQDAHFFNDSILSCNTLWEAGRPYVIYNSILVDSLCSLTIGPGVQVFSHPGSYIFVKGSLQVNGTPDQRVLFTNDRRDEFYKDAPGQWEGIYFLEGSISNHLSFTDIRNGVLGIRLGAPDNDTIPEVVLSETRIENMSEYGILTFTSDLTATNTLVNSCRLGCVGNFAGGNYRYTHCTFSNFPVNFSAEGPAVVFSDNLLLSDNSVLEKDISVSLINSIIWGMNKDEITLSTTGYKVFTLLMNNNLLKTTDTSLGLGNNILNKDPLFINTALYNYHTDTNSPARDAGLNQGILIDLEGNTRDATPDIGAYEK
ncbi:MAG: right-handed parallel beta-helix repeat-containing protein, partial [Cyclobacteriaceae bacterium]|nr:right-handed parallel beta-helix repeat-containing protein [Cyclobacteriaceae bacterium]